VGALRFFDLYVPLVDASMAPVLLADGSSIKGSTNFVGSLNQRNSHQQRLLIYYRSEEVAINQFSIEEDPSASGT
jgi:hypothetical protein